MSHQYSLVSILSFWSHIGYSGHPKDCPICLTNTAQSYLSVLSFCSHIGLSGHPQDCPIGPTNTAQSYLSVLSFCSHIGLLHGWTSLGMSHMSHQYNSILFVFPIFLVPYGTGWTSVGLPSILLVHPILFIPYGTGWISLGVYDNKSTEISVILTYSRLCVRSKCLRNLQIEYQFAKSSAGRFLYFRASNVLQPSVFLKNPEIKTPH